MKGENVPINNNFFSESALLFREIRTRAPVRQGKMYMYSAMHGHELERFMCHTGLGPILSNA